MLDMKVVLAGLMPSHDYVPSMFLAIAWPPLDMRNQGVSYATGSLGRQA